MSLKIYSIINCFVFILILLFFIIISSFSICIAQFNFSFLILYIFRHITHVFEIYNAIVLLLFITGMILITYYIEKTRRLLFIMFLSLILIVALNTYDLKSIFIYKSQEIDIYFYTYFLSYVLSFTFWYVLLKKNMENTI